MSWAAGQPAAPIRRIDDLLKLTPGERAAAIAGMTPPECDQLHYDWKLLGAARAVAAAGRLDRLADPRRARRRQDARRRRGGARWAKSYSHRQPHRPDRGRRARRDGAGRIRHPQHLPAGTSGRAISASAGRLEWPNGAVSLLFSAEEPDRLRGKQHMKLWCDELAAWRRPEAFDQAMFGLRLGDKPQMVVTTTPRPSRIIKQLAAGKDTIVTRGSTFDNRRHLASAFLERIAKRYEGRAIGRQELFAEIVEETPGRFVDARADRAPARSRPRTRRRTWRRSWSAVDPPARSGSKADECGLVVAGKAGGRIYVLADLTSQGDSPAGWAARVGAAYRGFRANRVVAEINNGGDMVAEVLRQAEPQSAGARRHTRRAANSCAPSRSPRPMSAASSGMPASFGKLEDQLCALTPDFDRRCRALARPRGRARLGDRRPARPGPAGRCGDDGILGGGRELERYPDKLP